MTAPLSKRQKLIKHEYHRLTREFGRDPSPEVVAAELEMDSDIVLSVLETLGLIDRGSLV